jgi:hypothetical protein
MDWLLEQNRAKLVIKYRQSKNLWPDGIDHAGNRWYGDGSAWTEERIKRALAWPHEIPIVNKDGTVNKVSSDIVNRRREAAREGMRKLRADRLRAMANPGKS